MGYDRVTMAAVEALAGRQGIGSRVSEGLRTVFPKRREVPTYSAEAVMDALGPHVNPNSRFAQEMTDFRQGPPPDLSDLAKGTLVRVGIGVGIATAVSLVAGCAPHIFPDGGGGVPDGDGSSGSGHGDNGLVGNPYTDPIPNPHYTGDPSHLADCQTAQHVVTQQPSTEIHPGETAIEVFNGCVADGTLITPPAASN